MKKLMILLAILCLLTGCAPADPTSAPTTLPGTSATEAASTTGSTAATQSTAPQGPVTFTLYLPNDTLDGLDSREITIDSLQPELILQYLAEHGAINMDARVLSAAKEGTQLHLDMNEAFLMELYSMGTTGEKMLVGCLVNTFLSAYSCETVMLTAEGQTIHSGHVDYDFPLGPYT